MKILLSTTLALCSLMLYSQGPITSAEYFIDQDPGAGNGTPVSISQSPAVSTSIAANVGMIDPGLHVMCLRVKNGEGRWSLYARSNFYVNNFAPGITLVAAECYFDEDPGFGNGIAIAVTPGGSIETQVSIALPDDMEKGLHVLHIRTQDALDKWSLAARRLFYFLPLDPAQEIVAAEYFIDEDPGFGAAMPLVMSPGSTLSEVFEIDTPETLSEGDHMLYMRVLRDDGAWSSYGSHPFTVDYTFSTTEAQPAFTIYPNPTSNELFLETDGQSLSRVRIIDMLGKVVQDEMYTGRPIRMGHLGKGTYLVQLQFADGYAASRRVVVQ